MSPDVVVGNVFDKYGSRNPLYRRVMERYFRRLEELLRRTQARRLLEVGCGEGFVSGWLSRRALGKQVFGADLSAPMLGEASREHPAVRFVAANAYSLPFPDGSFDLVLCLEILEHLEQPQDALREARRVSNQLLIASVPNEPIWRLLNVARGAYWIRLGNTPGHVQHWNRRGFTDLLRRSWVVREVATPFPWTMALCSRE